MEKKRTSKAKVIAANASIAAVFWALGIVFRMNVQIEGFWFIAGNAPYYGAAVIMAFLLNDKRVTSSEFILCQTCKDGCPTHTLRLSTGLDAGFREKLRSRA